MRKCEGEAEGGAQLEGSSRASSSCAACKLLKRRCTKDCIFAPYYRADEPKKFAKVHKVFGASNVSKILQEVPLDQRHDTVLSLSYEAEARLLDPVYGCLGPIALLHHRLAQLHLDLTLARARLASFHAIPPPPLPEELQIYAALPPMTNEVGCEIYEGALLPGEADDQMGNLCQNDHSSNNSELLSGQSTSGCYDNDYFGQVPLLPL